MWSFMSSAGDKIKNIGKYKSKTLSSKCSQKILDNTKDIQKMHSKLLRKE